MDILFLLEYVFLYPEFLSCLFTSIRNTSWRVRFDVSFIFTHRNSMRITRHPGGDACLGVHRCVAGLGSAGSQTIDAPHHHSVAIARHRVPYISKELSVLNVVALTS